METMVFCLFEYYFMCFPYLYVYVSWYCVYFMFYNFKLFSIYVPTLYFLF